ncbi:ComEC family competence protein [Allosphingosinicella flava]|uniref:ComEC family competence protein n=1 Tax=Allosphingosinicella flava TaxID=2771430 RepID=A0A7T2GKH1_9SPHN|nr:ComEC/Rec2 family competence protein [Sphingosinicella flava]QPQ55530.1 ComEC family competence protein [Sphingosinicella flava]
MTIEAADPREAGWGPSWIGRGAAGWRTKASAALEHRLDAERDQLALWVPAALGLGIAMWFALAGEGSWIAFMLVASGGALGLFAIAGQKRWGRSLGLALIFAALGCALIWARAERVAAPRLTRPMVTALSGTILSVEPLPARGIVRLLVRPDGGALPPRIRVTVKDKGAPEGLQPGAGIAMKARLMPPAPMALPGAYDFARVAWFQRIGATGNALGAVVIIRPPFATGWAARLAEWRRSLSSHIQSRVEGGGGGIAAALATGDQGAIPEADAEAMRQSGLAHLLSISGLHVTAVVGAAMLLTLKLLALSPRLALRWPLILIGAGAGAVTGIAYTLLTGSEVPTIRSCIAALIVLAGIAMGREAITLRLVAAGALVVLLFWPEALAGPSFQLSFAAVTAIVALHDHPRIKALFARREEDGWPARFGRALLSLLLTGLAVEAVLAPIALFHFHKAGLYGAFANIVAIPLTTFVIMPAEALALLFDTMGLGAPFWWLVEQALNGLLWVAHATAAAPGSVAMLPAMPGGAFALMIGGGLWVALWRTRWRRWGFVPIVLGAAWALATPSPDLIVTGDGRHLALRTADGGMALLRDRAGEYVRDMLSEGAGLEGDLTALEDAGGAACNADLCATDIVTDGRRWRILATRSPHFVDFGPLSAACASADIVVSDRTLPRTCVPRWLKADRKLLGRTGGLSIHLGGESPSISTVADRIGGHPWNDY